MAIFDEKGRGTLLGFAMGVGAAVIVRQLFPALQTVGKPLAKAAIKSGITAYQKTRETIAQIGETVEDVAAEAIFEMQMEEVQKAAATVKPPATDGGE